MPPVEIDGNPITGATIDGTDVQEITVDGDVVFSAGPPANIIDNFEDGDLTPLDSDWGNWVNGTNVSTNDLGGTRAYRAFAPGGTFVDHESVTSNPIQPSQLSMLVRFIQDSGTGQDRWDLFWGSASNDRFIGTNWNLQSNGPFNFSLNETYRDTFQLDYTNNTTTQEITRVSDGTIVFTETKSKTLEPITKLFFRIDANSSGSSMEAYIDEPSYVL